MMILMMMTSGGENPFSGTSPDPMPSGGPAQSFSREVDFVVPEGKPRPRGKQLKAQDSTGWKPGMWRGWVLPVAVNVAMPWVALWAWRTERRTLRDGRPLFTSEWAAAVRVGVKHPEKVRVIAVDEVPVPGLRWMHHLAARWGFDRKHIGGLCLRYGILLRRDLAAQQVIMAHELVHTAQFERHGSMAGFLRAYLLQCLREGYANAPLEREAVMKSQR
jgi:hypothetical protein